MAEKKKRVAAYLRVKGRCQHGENKVTARFCCSAAFNDTFQKSNLIFNEKTPRSMNNTHTHTQRSSFAQNKRICVTPMMTVTSNLVIFHSPYLNG